jgi:hypothetical protein
LPSTRRKVVLKILYKRGLIVQHTTEPLNLIFELMTISCGIKILHDFVCTIIYVLVLSLVLVTIDWVWIGDWLY